MLRQAKIVKLLAALLLLLAMPAAIVRADGPADLSPYAEGLVRDFWDSSKDPTQSNQPATTCDLAAYYAILALYNDGPALYSQGGALDGDPIQPNGTYYPRTGADSFDCSGLPWWAYAKAGELQGQSVNIGANTYQQVNAGIRISCTLGDAAAGTCWQPGDLVFLRYQNGQHVAMYADDGQFLDCYNHATGCIIHQIHNDPFYIANFWQARRPVSCAGSSDLFSEIWDMGGGSYPSSGLINPEYPRFEFLPDIVPYLSFTIPQCTHCDPAAPDNGVASNRDCPIRPAGSAYSERDLVGQQIMGENSSWVDLPGMMVKQVLLGWYLLSQTLADLYCILLSLLQSLINALLQFGNLYVAVINIFLRMLIFVWLTIRIWLYEIWTWLGGLTGMANMIIAFLNTTAATIITQLSFLDSLAATIIAQLSVLDVMADAIITFLNTSATSIIDLLNTTGEAIATNLRIVMWLFGLTFGIQRNTIDALSGTSFPSALTVDDARAEGAFCMTRGVFEGVTEHPFVTPFWLLMIALIYLSWGVWLTRTMLKSLGG